ncbi:hypothetical protein BGZ58_000406 [Dissophora ornata]|nr:hypothetical protein BGZ58_000406 [Dissophora ornata]
MELIKDMLNMSKSTVGGIYGLSSSTAHDIWKARDAMVKQYQKPGPNISKNIQKENDSNANGVKASASIRAIDLRSGLRAIDPPLDFVSSLDSGVLEPGTRAKILQGALEALDRAKEQILRQQMSVIVFDSNAKHYAALLRDQPDVLNDPVLFEMGPYSPEAEDTMHTNDAVDTMTSWVLLIC